MLNYLYVGIARSRKTDCALLAHAHAVTPAESDDYECVPYLHDL